MEAEAFGVDADCIHGLIVALVLVQTSSTLLMMIRYRSWSGSAAGSLIVGEPISWDELTGRQ